MELLLYDICSFITKNGSKNFGIIRLQTDNTFNIGTEAFMKKKETEIIKFKIKAKTQTILQSGVLRDFNGYHMIIEVESIIVMQKNQVEKFVLVNIKNNAKKQQYVKQRACRAYIVSIC